jgi:PncC family amidohydrolase
MRAAAHAKRQLATPMEEAEMDDLLPLAEKIAALLKERGESIAVAESSTGGLISAALLAVPGASAYFLGGAVIYTRSARTALLGIQDEAMAGMRASTEAYASLLARTVQQRFSATWGVGESGATGPTGNRYGDAAGHSCIAVAGPSERAITLETGVDNRLANMHTFAATALDLLVQALAQ